MTKLKKPIWNEFEAKAYLVLKLFQKLKHAAGVGLYCVEWKFANWQLSQVSDEMENGGHTSAFEYCSIFPT